MIKWLLRLLYSSLAVFALGIMLWMFYPAKVYERGQHEPVLLLGNFHSFMSSEEVTKALETMGTSAEINDDSLNFDSKHLDIRDMVIEDFKGDIVFSFINDKLVSVKFSSHNIQNFRKYIEDSLDPDKSRKINMPESSNFIVISDSRLADEFASHMRRYGSD